MEPPGKGRYTLEMWRPFVFSIVILRVVDAFIWLGGAVGKHPWRASEESGYPRFGWFRDWVVKEEHYAQIPAYKWFLGHVVLPHIDLFGWLQFLTEAFLGVALLLGLFVGVTGLVATLWAFNIALGSYPVPGEQLYALQLFVLAPFVLWTARAGRAWGVDAALHRRWRASRSVYARWAARWLV